MIAILLTLLLSLVCWRIGHAFVQMVAHSSDFQSSLEKGAAGFILGHFVVGWSGLLLAELGVFSLLSLSLAVAALWFLGWAAKSRWGDGETAVIQNHPSPSSHALFHSVSASSEKWVLLGWLLIAGWLFLRPHQFIIGAADAGVYVNLAAEIAQNGSIVFQDELLANLSPEMQALFLRPIDNPVASTYILPAFYVIGEPVGEITPQFYPLHPVWQAIGFSLGHLLDVSVQTALLMTGLWALLGVLMIYLTVRRLVGWQTAVFALIAMTVNGLQVWFARYPVTEALTQFLLWGSFWAIVAWLGEKGNSRKDSKIWPLLAGLTTGQLFLVRIDMIFILPALALLILWLVLQKGWQREFLFFIVPLVGLFLHSLIHALWQSEPYFFDLFNFAVFLLSNALWLPIGGAFAGLFFLGLLWWQRDNAKKVFTTVQKPVQWGSSLLFIGFCAYLYFVRANITPPAGWTDPFSGGSIPFVHHENLLRLGWYLSPFGVWFGAMGIAFLLFTANRQTGYLLAVGLLFSFVYLWNLRANPHQVYAMRRYVPMVMPLFVMGALLLLHWLATHKERFIKYAAFGVVLVWLGGFAWSARGLVTQVDYQDVPEQMTALTAQLAPNAILIFDDQRPIGQGDILGTPLRFLHKHDVLTVRDVSLLDPINFEVQIQQWQAEQRPIYWFDTDNGAGWPLADEQLSFVNEYSISSQVLEARYDRRPQQLVPFAHNGRIYKINP